MKKPKKNASNLLLIAFRNLGRHKVKTVVTSLAIAMGVTAYIFIDAWLIGMNLDSQRNLINYETGAAKIYTAKYFEQKDDMPMAESFKDYNKLIDRLNQNGYAASPNSVFSGSLISTENDLPFMFIGVDPELEKSVLKWNNHIEEGGNYLQSGKFGIVLGSRGARDLKVGVGDSVRLSTVIDKKDENGKIRHINQALELIVIGIINSPNPRTNGNIGYLPLDILQDEMGLLLEGHITQLLIRKSDSKIHELPGQFESAKNISQTLNGLLNPELKLVSWQEDAKDYIAVSRGDNVSNRIFILFFMLITFIGMANTMLMAVLERTREIGMLRAIGMDDKSVIRLFVIEAGLIGLIGTVIGILAGIVINIFMVNYGIDYSAIYKSMNMDDFGYRIVGIFRSAWNFHTMAWLLIIMPLASALVASIPAVRSVKISVVEALRFE